MFMGLCLILECYLKIFSGMSYSYTLIFAKNSMFWAAVNKYFLVIRGLPCHCLGVRDSALILRQKQLISGAVMLWAELCCIQGSIPLLKVDFRPLVGPSLQGIGPGHRVRPCRSG